MSVVVGGYNEMDEGELDNVDRFNEETFGSGAVGKRGDLLPKALLLAHGVIGSTSSFNRRR